MKILLAAMALTIAAPIAAQTAPPANPHAGHDQHKDHSGSADHKPCCESGKMDCCKKAKADGAKMDCCKEHAAKQGGDDAHAGHDMGKH